VIGWSGETEVVHYWNGKIDYSEFSGLNIHALIDEYKRFIDKNRKNIRKGFALIFIDNPFNFLKAIIKKTLKRGVGYSFRKKL
jgi:hypothetical protein